jgi:hypothetical protein
MGNLVHGLRAGGEDQAESRARRAKSGDVLVLALCSLLAASASRGQNLLPNGGFNTTSSGWSPTSGSLALNWSSLDARGSSGSGSLQMTNTSSVDNNGYNYIGFCISVTPGRAYHEAASFYFPSSQARDAGLAVSFDYYSSPDCSSGLLSGSASAIALPAPAGTWLRLDTQLSVAPVGAAAALVTFDFRKVGGGGSIVANLDDAVFEAAGSNLCYSTDAFLCLGSRFTVAAQWSTGSGSTVGHAVQLTSDTGYFWFFSPSNIEMVVKALDACPVNGRQWLFAGGLTNVNVVLTVTDTQTGAVRIYVNPQSTPFQPIQDTSAFSTCP